MQPAHPITSTAASTADQLAAEPGAASASPAHGFGARRNGGAHSAPHTDLRQVVVEAVEVAAERGLPLAGATHQGVDDGAEPAPVMQALKDIAPRMRLVESEIERLVTTPVKLISDVASHTLNAGGKRLRPALTLLAAELCGDSSAVPDPRVVVCAAAIELTHTATLLHDDVVDESATRRGKPTANMVWGNQTSVLVGDYLFAQVFVIAAREGFIHLMQPLALATARMCAGELLETQTRGYTQMTEDQYRDIIAHKTAALTECACRMGAMAMDADAAHVERLARFGLDIGMAFQIVDDIFDVTTTASKLGKPVGNDIRAGDVTLPMLRALEVCSSDEREELAGIIGHLPVSEAAVARALAIIRASDAVPYARAMALEYIDSAKAQLEVFPSGGAHAMLDNIADYVINRQN